MLRGREEKRQAGDSDSEDEDEVETAKRWRELKKSRENSASTMSSSKKMGS